MGETYFNKFILVVENKYEYKTRAVYLIKISFGVY